MKPQLTIDLVAPEGNAYMLIAKAQTILIAAGLRKLADELGEQFEQIANNPENTYQDVRHLAEQFCTVTWDMAGIHSSSSHMCPNYPKPLAEVENNGF